MWPPQLRCSHVSGRQSACNWSHLRMIAFHSDAPGPSCGYRKRTICPNCSSGIFTVAARNRPSWKSVSFSDFAMASIGLTSFGHSRVHHFKATCLKMQVQQRTHSHFVSWTNRRHKDNYCEKWLMERKCNFSPLVCVSQLSILSATNINVSQYMAKSTECWLSFWE